MGTTLRTTAGSRHVVRRILTGVLLILGMAAAERVHAQSPKLVELVENTTAFQGKIVARTSDSIWLMERDGRQRRINPHNITGFQKLSDEFIPFSAAEMRDLLRREYRDLEVVGTGHYLVAGPPQIVRDYAQVFEDQYRAFHAYFSVRGFDLPEPEFPLVAIVFPDREAFAKNAKRDGIQTPPGLRGYYTQSTNRISLFHDAPVKSSGRDPEQQDKPAPRFWATTGGDLESTMIHEATHQVAFNIGIHNRLGNTNPRWLVEGLATAFEAPGMRNSTFQRTPGAKLNQSRLADFRDYRKHRRPPKSLEAFVRTGDLSGMNVLDGYAQSWALTYFLIETRSRDYAHYVKLISARPPFEEYTEKDRLADFREAFGNDLVLLEANFLRFLEQAH